jgi:cytidylate kinase
LVANKTYCKLCFIGKEELVIKLYKEGKTFREIASAAHLSFSDIKKITRNIDGYNDDINLSNKTKATQALHLFKEAD